MKVLVVEDHPLVREAMAHLVTRLDAAASALEAPDGATALALARAHADVGLVLLDLGLPGLRGMVVLERLRRDHPGVPVVVLSAFHDRDTVGEVMRQGAAGFIPKTASRDTIVNALRLVLAGSLYVPPELAFDTGWPAGAPVRGGCAGAPVTATPPDAAALGLTPRQGQVLGLVMKGHANKEICRQLGLAERTVKAHLSAVLNLLRVSSRTQAVIAANRLGLDPELLLATPAADA